MANFTTITFRNGVTTRATRDTDVNGAVKADGQAGTLRIHESREAAVKYADNFWVNRGYKSDLTHYGKS